MKLEIPELNQSSRGAVWLFLRGLAVVYFFAFAPLIGQITGLLGSQGILPAADYLSILRDTAHLGTRAFFGVPTLFWFHLGDGTLRAAAWAGVGLSALLFFDVAPALVLALLWALTLSIVSIGQDFFAFQWDSLLLEVGLLAVLLAPWRLRPRFMELPDAPRFPLFLLRWVLFRLLFLSGVVKLASHDPTWRDLTALVYHYMTQPLPTPLSWYFAQGPLWTLKVSAGYLFLVELVLPFLFFAGSAPRRIAFAGVVLLQLLLMATGNFCFLNLLTIVLSFLLLDDACFASIGSWAAALSRPFQERPIRGARAAAIGGLGGFLFFWSLVVTADQVGGNFESWPGFRTINAAVAPWRCVNDYGLFAVMTRTRNEIWIEGSDDGTIWKTYRFRFKPGDPMRMPRFIAPWQPRLDWQMWFAALSTGEKTPWFPNLIVRLLQGSRDVDALFAENPFAAHPPRYVRALFSTYRFTTPAEHAATGAWWVIEPAGWYYPATSLDLSGD